MIYAKTDGQTVIEYPVYEYHIKNRGHRIDMYEPVIEVAAPAVDSRFSVAVEETPVFIDGELTQVWRVRYRSVADVKTDMLSALASARYSIEISGIDVGGLHVATDRESYGRTVNIYQALASGLLTSTEYKLADNTFMTVTSAEDFEQIVSGVINHVSGCYKAEKIVADAIDAITDISDLEVFDVIAEMQTALNT